MTTLYLVRHGETVDNQNQIMQGQTDGCLTLFGMEQARQLGLRLRQEGLVVDAFLTSDLYRAVQTCRLLAVQMGHEPDVVVPIPLLRERDWGSFTGRFIPDLKDEPWPADIETLDAMKARAQAFLDLVATRYAGMTVLAVGHGIMNKAVQSVHYGRPMQDIVKMTNCEVRRLQL